MSSKVSSSRGPFPRLRADSIWELLDAPLIYSAKLKLTISSTATVVINAQNKMIPTVSTLFLPCERKLIRASFEAMFIDGIICSPQGIFERWALLLASRLQASLWSSRGPSGIILASVGVKGKEDLRRHRQRYRRETASQSRRRRTFG